MALISREKLHELSKLNFWLVIELWPIILSLFLSFSLYRSLFVAITHTHTSHITLSTQSFPHSNSSTARSADWQEVPSQRPISISKSYPCIAELYAMLCVMYARYLEQNEKSALERNLTTFVGITDNSIKPRNEPMIWTKTKFTCTMLK